MHFRYRLAGTAIVAVLIDEQMHRSHAAIRLLVVGLLVFAVCFGIEQIRYYRKPKGV